MLKALSAAYYVGRVIVEPHDGPHAVLEEHQHREAATTVYARDEGVERLDVPLVVKLGHQHLPVFASPSVPTGTLAVPDDVLAASDVEHPPSVREILVATADWAGRLLEWWTPYTAADGTATA